MDSCVEGVMADHKDDKDFSKENAIAICHTRIVGGLMVEIVQDPTELNIALGTSFKPGELMRWENAELAKAEVNANSDELSEEDIVELAATLPLMAVDDEHLSDRVVGLFTAARASEDHRLLTDGLVYARRFPEVVQDIMNGTKHLSIEAYADSAICSICGEEFAKAQSYCDHLRGRPASGAVRRFKGIRAVGGGVVRRPAGSTAGFDLNRIYMVASHQEEEPVGDLLTFLAVEVFGEDQPDGDVVEAAKEKWSKDVDLKEGALSAIGWPSAEKIASAIKSGKVSYATAIRRLAYLANVSKDQETASKARRIMETLKGRFRKGDGDNKSEGGTMELEEVKAQLEEALRNLKEVTEERDGLQQERDGLQASVTSLEASVQEKEGELESLRTRNAELVMANRKMVLASVMSGEEFEAQKDVIASMSDEAVKLLASKGVVKPALDGKQFTPNLDSGGGDGNKVEVTL